MRSDLTGRKIFIVDDESDIRDFLRWEFEERGAMVLEAGDGKTGEEIFRSETPDFSLLDVRMPGGTGLDLLARCKTLTPECPIALMTGFTEISTGKIYNYGACDVFVKPLKYEFLFPRIDKELLPLKSRLSLLQPPDVSHVMKFPNPMLEMESQGDLLIGRGGFSAWHLEIPTVRTGEYMKVIFPDKEIYVKLCWFEKKSLGYTMGFEWIHVLDQDLPWLLTQIQSKNQSAYIPYLIKD